MVREPGVFISYSRRDVELVQELERGLRQVGVRVWCDDKQLLAGQQWPTVLGKALEDCDCLVLVWSEHAAASAHVEREWNAAIALKKVILPFRLDATPLPALLLGSHFVDAHDVEAAVPRIAEALKGVGATRAVDGTGSKRRPTWGRWVVGGALAAVFLAAVMALAFGWKGAPEPAPRTGPHSEQTEVARAQAEEQSLSGLIRDEAGEPVANVEVSLPKLGAKTATDASGYFHLRASAEKQATVDLMARKQGYETYESFATLGNSSYEFTLKKR